MSQTSGALTMSLGLLERALDAVLVAADVAAKNGEPASPSLSGNLENAATHSVPARRLTAAADAPLAIESSEATPAHRLRFVPLGLAASIHQ